MDPGALQRGLVAFICRIILGISRSTDGRPDLERTTPKLAVVERRLMDDWLFLRPAMK